MGEDISRAIQSAKYNECVQITVVDDEGNSQEVCLVACLDNENGGVQWNAVDNLCNTNCNSYSNSLRRHLRTKRWIFPMLNDHQRNDLYTMAIDRASERLTSRFCSSDAVENPSHTKVHCLDIGSGTGLLAMISAENLTERLGNHFVEVTSIEMSSAMARIARETVSSNDLGARVNVVEGHSCEISPLHPKALICTSELLESGLLGEGWIPAIRDAWERHLDSTAIVIPSAAKVYAQIIEGPGVFNLWGPHRTLDGFPNGRCLSLSLNSEDTKFLLTGNGSVHLGVQAPIHIHKLLQDSKYPIRVLSDPVEVLEVRVDSKDNTPSSDGRTRSTTIVPSESGVAHGVLFWWELELFGDDLAYNTRTAPWQDHWQQCVYAFSTPPDDCPRIQIGEPVTIQTSHDDFSISFSILPSHTESESCVKRLRTSADSNKLVSSLRAWQLNDLGRSAIIRNGIEALLRQKGLDAIVLDISDFSLCAMIAALLGASNVSSLEASSTNLPEATARIAQVTNSLPLLDQDGHTNIFQLIRCHPEQLTTDILGGEQVDIVVAEPYYEILEGWALQEALNFLYILRGLKKRKILQSDALVMPLYAKIMGCAFESMDIYQAYRVCESQVCGFSHDVVNKYHTLHDHDIPLPSWQYDTTPISDSFEIATLDYIKCTIEQNSLQRILFKKSGTCNGMLVWIEYGIPTSFSNETTQILSTRERPNHQGIRLLKKPATEINIETDFFHCEATFGKQATSCEDYNFNISVQRGTIEG